jgi:hypothetical protein
MGWNHIFHFQKMQIHLLQNKTPLITQLVKQLVVDNISFFLQLEQVGSQELGRVTNHNEGIIAVRILCTWIIPELYA